MDITVRYSNCKKKKKKKNPEFLNPYFDPNISTFIQDTIFSL